MNQFRERKFRVYDTKDKKYLKRYLGSAFEYGDEILGIKGYGVGDGVGGGQSSDFLLITKGNERSYFNGSLSAVPNLIIEDYTGKDDETGKKLYEGDVFYIGDAKHILYKVFWYKNGWYYNELNQKNTKFTFQLPHNTDKIKTSIYIVGNIHSKKLI